jgi:prepilin-type N-terminal cleavage/methylation domain-containing protein
MIGRRLLGRRMRSGLTLVELLVAIAVLGLFEALLLTARVQAPVSPTPLSLAVPVLAPLMPAGGELSLQTTLDRLGFTVNVPSDYQGRRLANWRAGRVSTLSDAVPSEWFEADGPVQFLEVSRQAVLGSAATFTAETTAGNRIELFPRIHSTSDDRLQPQTDEGAALDMSARGATCQIDGTLRFVLDFPANLFNPGLLYSTGEDNPDGVSHMLALPARKGGTWVDEGGNTGHWEGGVADGTSLLCWEDTVHGDNDFQDLVIYAKGIRPTQR